MEPSEEADLIVLATGYQSQEAVVREMLGDRTADRVGQIWGIAPNGEIASMFVATPQPGLWFTGGGFAHLPHLLAFHRDGDQGA